MNSLEERVRVLEKQVRRYRILNLVVALVVLAWAAYIVSRLMKLQMPVNRVEPVVRTNRLEIIEATASRPVCVLRAVNGVGRVEVMNAVGSPNAGFDGASGLVVRSSDGSMFPE